MKGIILAGEQDDRLYPLTMGIPKQLLPIYNKPMIFYPIETLVEVGVNDILIITSPQHTTSFVNALGDGSSFGAHFTYATQANPEGAAQAFTIGEEFLAKESVCFITGDCIIMGDDRANKLSKAIRAAKNSGQATIFVSNDFDPKQYGVAKLDKNGKCMNVEGNVSDSAHYSITGLYVFPKGVADYAKVIEKSERGRLEVTTLNQMYLRDNKLQVQILGDNFRWFDTNSFNSIMAASNYIQKNFK